MKLELSRDVAKRLRGNLRQAGRKEIGGVLMGEQLAEGHFKIVDYSVDDQAGGYAHFVRSADHHRQALEAFFARTGAEYNRFNYLGEWHSHPSFSVQPSAADCASMVSLVEGERGIHFAVLVIVRLRLWTMLELSASLFVRGERAAAAEFEYSGS